jgi:hypothetical protein
MCQRTTLHRLVDPLPDEDLSTVGRLLAGLAATADSWKVACSGGRTDDPPVAASSLPYEKPR